MKRVKRGLKCGSGFQLYKLIIRFPSGCFKIHDTDLYAKLLAVCWFPSTASEYSSCARVNTNCRCSRHRKEMPHNNWTGRNVWETWRKLRHSQSGSQSRNKRWPGLLLYIMISIHLSPSCSQRPASLAISGLAPWEPVASLRLNWPWPPPDSTVWYHTPLPCAWI
jgi:hypothetical protein